MDILRLFYERVSKSNNLEDLGIPPSEVFYVRKALEERTGVCYTLEHVECSLYLEGRLSPDKHFLTSLPQWYVDKYMEGKMPDMEVLRDKLRVLYNQHLERQSLLFANVAGSEADSESSPPK